MLIDILNRSEAFNNRAIIYPTWKDKHKGHLKSFPNSPSFGLILSKILPYNRIEVKPYDDKIKNINHIISSLYARQDRQYCNVY
jgi:hypothetical protein